MHLLGQSIFLRALGWALINSLWQFGLLWLLVLIFIGQRPHRSSIVKHQVVLLAVSTGFAWFVADFLLGYFSAPAHGFLDSINIIPYYTQTQASFRYFLDNNLSYFSAAYLLVVTFLFIRFTGYFRHLHLLKTRGVHKLKASLRVYVEQLAQQLSIRRKVQVWLSENVDTPMILGFLGPIILLPIASINQLSVKQIEAILLHELVHIKRNDYLINACIASIEIILFFNPFVKLMVRTIKQEREKSCDEWVLQFRFDPFQYASALFTLEKNRLKPVGIGIAATGETERFLLYRIERIMGIERKPVSKGMQPVVFLSTVLLLAVIVLVNPAEKAVERMSNLLVANSRQQPAWLAVGDSVSRFTIIRPVPDNPPPTGAVKLPAIGAKEPIEHDNRNEDTLASNESQRVNVSNLLPENADDAAEDAGMYTAKALTSRSLDFSLIEPEEPVAPPVPAAESLPFVPRSSFTFSITSDTAVRPGKLESYAEHKAKEAMAKAQKAINQIDWKKIEQSMQHSKVDIAALKKEIEASLKLLNWQLINQQVDDSLNVEYSQRMRLLLKKDYDSMKVYKERQQQFETIRQSLKDQELQYKLESERKIIELQRQLGRRKVIIHI